jgi:hypothetical protein
MSKRVKVRTKVVVRDLPPLLSRDAFVSTLTRWALPDTLTTNHQSTSIAIGSTANLPNSNNNATNSTTATSGNNSTTTGPSANARITYLDYHPGYVTYDDDTITITSMPHTHAPILVSISNTDSMIDVE